MECYRLDHAGHPVRFFMPDESPSQETNEETSQNGYEQHIPWGRKGEESAQSTEGQGIKKVNSALEEPYS